MNELEEAEDHKFLAQLTWPRGTRVEVPCKLFLPRRVGAKLRLVFLVDKHTFHSISREPCSLSAEAREGDLIIEACELQIGGGKQKSWGQGLDEGYLTGYPRNLRLIERISPTADGLRGVFRLTHSIHLEPFDIMIPNYDGSIEWKRGERFRFELAEGIKLTFDHEYRYDTSKPKEIRAWPELIAQVDALSQPSAKSLEGYLSHIDDLLLLVSLAEGRRCACLEATWVYGDELITLYRLSRSVPTDRPDHDAGNFVIDHDDLALFLSKAFAALKAPFHRDLLWNALASVTHDATATIGEEFLRLFSALESVALAFRRANGLEFVVEEKQWKGVQKTIRTLLKSQTELKEESRRMLVEKLPELNRVSLRRAIDTMASQLMIQLDDVWPLFDRAEGCALADIRNMLVHGEYFSSPEWRYILSAQSCLRTITQRFLLVMLGWDYRRSSAASYDVWPDDWREARALLSSRK